MSKEKVMNKKILIIIAAVILAGGAVFAFAQHRRGEGPKGGGFGHRGMGMAMRELNLTDDQKIQVKAIFDSSRETVKPVLDELKANREKLMQLSGQAFDVAQVSEIAKRQGELMSQLIVEHERAKSKIFAILTDEQKAKAKEMQDKMKDHLGGFKGHRGEPGEGPGAF
jgi:Spy/CpxP family protein refolding chaperone